MVGCWSFTSGQHLRSYQVLICDRATHGNFIVLAHWEAKSPASWPDIPLSHITLTLSRPVLALF